MIRLIHEQFYQPGERIREQEVAGRFGVSRGPERETLRILEAKTAMRFEPMRGAHVKNVTDEERQATRHVA